LSNLYFKHNIIVFRDYTFTKKTLMLKLYRCIL